MNDADALIQAVLDRREDDTPRLVYADWLDDHGDAARASFIRLQVERARKPRKADRYRPDPLELKLLRKHWRDWLPPDATPRKSPRACVWHHEHGTPGLFVEFNPGNEDPRMTVLFARGFVRGVACSSWVWWYRCQAALLAAHPVEDVVETGGMMSLDPPSAEELRATWPGIVFHLLRAYPTP